MVWGEKVVLSPNALLGDKGCSARGRRRGSTRAGHVVIMIGMPGRPNRVRTALARGGPTPEPPLPIWPSLRYPRQGRGALRHLVKREGRAEQPPARLD